MSPVSRGTKAFSCRPMEFNRCNMDQNGAPEVLMLGFRITGPIRAWEASAPLRSFIKTREKPRLLTPLKL